MFSKEYFADINVMTISESANKLNDVVSYPRLDFEVVNDFLANNLVFYITDSEPTYLIHEHFYNSYTRVNTLRHAAYCDCGAYILEQHVISQNVLFNDEYIVRNICLKCGGLVDLGFVVMSSPQTAIIKTIGETSENDYLTSDGTILLDSSRDNYSNLNMPLEFELYEEKYTIISRS